MKITNMHEITSDEIAAIATRLYRQLPEMPDGTSLRSLPAAQQVGPPASTGGIPAGISPVIDVPTAAVVPPLQSAGIPSTLTPGPAVMPVLMAAPAGLRPPVYPFDVVNGGNATPLSASGLSDSEFSRGLNANSLPITSSRTPGTLPFSESTASASPPGLSEASDGKDGLRRFVERIRVEHTGQSSGFCHQDPLLQGLRQKLSARIAADLKSRPFDVHQIRRDFPILQQRVHGKPLIWLDNAATTQKPRAVIEKIKSFYENDNSNIHRAAHTLAARSTDAYEAARQKIQKFLGAGTPEQIVFVRGTTEGINLVAHTFGRKYIGEGDEIVLSTLEHHANIVPWQMIAQENRAILRVIPVTDRGEIQMEEYQRLLGPRTRLVALTQASNSLGTILPVAEMTQLAKRAGARVLIDGAQSVAHLPVNVQQMDCDFFVFSGHKIFGPTGIGAVYAKSDVLESMPPWQGGGNMIRDVTFEQTTYQEPPARFEAGTPNVADAVGLGAALDYVGQLGLANIASYEHELLQYATHQLSRINGLTLIGTAPEKVGVLSFVLRGHREEEVGRRLDQEGIAVRAGHHCSQPSLRRFGLEATVRPSLSLYNTREEIDQLAEAIRKIQHR